MRKKTHHKLEELSKFASGLVLGDFLCGLWLYMGGYIPVTFWGFEIQTAQLTAWLVTDVLLFLFLLHYGWHFGKKSRSSMEKKFHMFAGLFFGLVALLHLSRIVFDFNFVIGSWHAPYWLNAIATVVTAFLSYVSFSLAKKD